MLLDKIKVILDENILKITNLSNEDLNNCFIELKTIFYNTLIDAKDIDIKAKQTIELGLNRHNFKQNFKNEYHTLKIYQNYELIYEKKINDKNKCIVLLSNKKFEDLTEQLIIGLSRYTTVDILHYTINYKSNLNYPNLTNIEFNIDGDSTDGQYMQFIKAPIFLDVLENQQYKKAIFLDSNIQVKSNINNLLKYTDELEEGYGPLFHKNPWDYVIAKGEYVPGPLLSDFLQLEKPEKQPNSHGVTMVVIFGQHHVDLFKIWKEVCFSKEINEIRKKEFLHDELILNVLMWKYNIKPKFFNFVLNVATEKDVEFFYNYTNPDHLLETDLNIFGLGQPYQSFIPYDKNEIFAFHCVKDTQIAKNINNIILEQEKNTKPVMEQSIYTNIIRNNDNIRSSFNINFINGPYLELKTPDDDDYYCEFTNPETNQVEFNVVLKNNHWARASKKYFVNWIVKIYKKSKLVHEYQYDCKGKRVYIALESKSIGDTLAWFPYVEEFRKKHDCQVIVSTFHNDWFKDQYSELEFVEPGAVVDNIYAMYSIGWYYNPDDTVNLNQNKSDIKLIPLQQAASDILGLEPVEIKPKLKLKQNIKKEKQVSIAIHSTAQAKYWNNPTGWQDVVDYLKELGYKVKLLSTEQDGYMGNFHPKGIEQLPAGPIEKVIEELQKSELFIGIGSGLSWLSWAVDVPTILISGFSYPYSEVQNNVYRIIPPKGSCAGCYNKFKLDAGDWNWCPDNKKYSQFECSKSIPSSAVIGQIKNILK